MSENAKPSCPECDEQFDPQDGVDRRDFLRLTGQAAAVLAVGGAATVPAVARAADTTRPPERVTRPAEALIRELWAGMSADQRRQQTLPWDHRETNSRYLTRQRMFNNAIGGRTLAAGYTRPQQELIERILRAMCPGEDGWRCVSRDGTWDGSRSMQACGVTFFGDMAPGRQWAFVFAGHHLTLRCDGDSEPGAAFGGPIYYGHTPNPYSRRNVFYYQTQAVMSVFDGLSERQRRAAVVNSGNPGEHEPSVQFRARGQRHPGIAFADLSPMQRTQVQQVMRAVLSPYRREDVDEVMRVIEQNGGMERIHLAFYRDQRDVENEPWSFWRLEGPGFVWNYRVLPHAHTYVNISSRV
jgi:hypothetical protein